MTDDEIDIHLRDPAQVVTRAIVVATLLRRLALEELTDSDANEAAAEAFDLREWLREHRLWDETTLHERSLLDRALGHLTETERLEEVWQGEGLLLLAWALGRIDVPSLGAPAAIDPVLAAIPAPWDDPTTWIEGTRLRLEPIIATERERAELWHWRAGIESARREASRQDRQDYEVAIHDVTAEAVAAGLLTDCVDDEFAINGRPVRSLPQVELDTVIALTAERLRALNWLCGFGASWDDVPLDI